MTEQNIADDFENLLVEKGYLTLKVYVENREQVHELLGLLWAPKEQRALKADVYSVGWEDQSTMTRVEDLYHSLIMQGINPDALEPMRQLVTLVQQNQTIVRGFKSG